MKKILLSTALLLILFDGSAHTSAQKNRATGAKKPVAQGVVLKTLEDSANYAMGLSVANFYKQQGVKKINTAIVTKAINDVMSGKASQLNDVQANSCMMNYLNKQQMEKSKPTIDSGEAFLATNKKKAGCNHNGYRLTIRSGHPRNWSETGTERYGSM